MSGAAGAGRVGAGADLAGLLADGVPTVLLTEADTPVEGRLIRQRIAAAGGTDRTAVELGPGLPAALRDLPDETRLVPVRVAWLPPEHAGDVEPSGSAPSGSGQAGGSAPSGSGRAGRRGGHLADLMPGHDPYHPAERRQRRILARHPGRATVMAGEPATVGSLRQRWAEAADDGDFAGYVARRAALALDRAEYQRLGPRYRTPSLVKEEILASRRFRSGLSRIRTGRADTPPSLEDAGQILDELAAGWSRRLIDVMPTAGRLIFQRGFDPQIDYDESQVERLRAAMARQPCILLWSHRSNLDNLVLSAAMQEKGLPPAHVFAGINMAFGPMGAILRRAGVVFIRRSTGDDPLYKFVLREYVSYLLEKRFNLSWSIEGTRSRTGKMLPPRLGLLSYAADAYLDRRVDDILLLPVSISFDQLHEISEYAAYAQGATKKPEGFGWLYGFIKAQGERHYGKVYVRFGEPVALSAFLGPPGGPVAADPAARRLALNKTAFEVAWRINQGMPVTATAAITTILLGMKGTALTFGQIRLGLADALAYLESRSVPQTASARALTAPGPVQATLDALVAGGLVSSVTGGREPVWLIAPEQQLAATFYRNSLVHFLLDTALCELAALRAAEAGAGGGAGGAGVGAGVGGAGGAGAGGGGAGGGGAGGAGAGGAGAAGADAVEVFWAEIAALRDLLKFEFYFRESGEHRRAVQAEMDRHDPAWEQRLRSGPAEAEVLLAGMRPLVSQVVVRPFVDAYRLVADVLAGTEGPANRDEVTKQALGLGRQYVAQGRLRSSESVSVLLFGTALQLADHRGLLAGDADATARRTAWQAELRDLSHRLDQIEHLALRRYLQDAVTVTPRP